jgi:hypothetical protein
MHHSVQMAALAEELSNRTRTGSLVARHPVRRFAVGQSHRSEKNRPLLPVYFNKQTFSGSVGTSQRYQPRTFLEAAVAASGQQANRVFGWTSCFSGASGGVECSCRRNGTCRNRRSGRTSSSGAIGRHTLLRDRPIFRFRSTIHHEMCAASAAARCVTSGERR